MKKFTILIVAAIVSIAAAVPASAQLKFGLKVGTAVNSLKFQSDNWEETFSTDNRAGFTGVRCLSLPHLCSAWASTLR